MGLATFLFGFRVKQPRDYLRLRRIRRGIHTTVGRLHAEISRSPEPVPFADIDPSSFRPIRPGTAWGAVFECAWLRVTGEVPPGVQDPVVLLGIGGEGLVYSPGGEVLDSVSTVFQQGDLPHSAGRFRPVSGVDTSTGRVEFYADVTYNGFILYLIGRAVYRGARLATRNAEVYSLYYDYLTLSVLADSTDDQALATELRAALDSAWNRFRARDVAGARAALAPALAAESTSEFTYSAIGHGHLDMAWLWPLRETRRKAARTYARALNAFDTRAGYIYGTSQPQQLYWIKQQHPALFERIKAAVADGRMELQGSFWVETDTNLPGGEALARQAMVGRRFLQEEFGLDDADLRLCWLPDTFGYSGNLPQILKKSGMDWFMTIKLAWNKVTVFPYRTFRWSGIDGSEVLVHMAPEGDYNSRGAADGLLTGLRQYPEKALDTALLIFGSGDGGGGPGEIHHEVTARERNLRGLPRVEYSTAGDFFRRLEKRDLSQLHSHRGELYLETHQGTYTTQAKIKKGNRLAERTLHNAEALAAIVGESSRAVLEPHWRDLLLGHFHDILPGSTIERVAREARESLDHVRLEVDGYIGGLLERLPRARASQSDSSPAEVGALNLTGLPRDEYLKTDAGWMRATAEPYASAVLAPTAPATGLVFTADSMSNGILSLRFGETGEIVSCVDASGIEHSADGLSRIVLHRDPYVFPFNAWDIDQGYLQRTPRILSLRHLETVIDGPTIARRQAYRSAKVTISQTVVLEAGSDVVRFDTRVEWHEKHHMLRADFRPVHVGDSALCEIQFGHLERVMTENTDVETAQFEVVAHKWIATENETGGFALLNDSKYGHRAKQGLISLNLLRAPTYPDPTADRGRHSFSYAFTPFAHGDLAKVVREGYRLNNPLLATSGTVLPSVASTTDPGVIIETIKPAEDGDGVVLRMYESLGRGTTTSLRTSLPHAAATETDLLERPVGTADLDRLEFMPFEIKTILLERAS
ncbi:alpha-mannosidase [Naasia lichenicola]|uniref:Alpha-mannosidase n=1 Tax=Naasia lichenicola TaxID=2565933 RepID=A0A4S4FQY2_9MICO|nr:glycoside hydrolase family 38 C-terminal domain-containing protein [Naasia lichenicola]THG31826.1 alpha-mannosidase [Naasia lichenicola]